MDENPQSQAARKREASRKTANSHFQAWEQRTALVKQQAIAESAANDAKTVRLKALRLEKERLDAEAAVIAARNAPPAPVKKPRAVKKTLRG